MEILEPLKDIKSHWTRTQKLHYIYHCSRYNTITIVTASIITLVITAILDCHIIRIVVFWERILGMCSLFVRSF